MEESKPVLPQLLSAVEVAAPLGFHLHPETARLFPTGWAKVGEIVRRVYCDASMGKREVGLSKTKPGVTMYVQPVVDVSKNVPLAHALTVRVLPKEEEGKPVSVDKFQEEFGKTLAGALVKVGSSWSYDGFLVTAVRATSLDPGLFSCWELTSSTLLKVENVAEQELSQAAKIVARVVDISHQVGAVAEYREVMHRYGRLKERILSLQQKVERGEENDDWCRKEMIACHAEMDELEPRIQVLKLE